MSTNKNNNKSRIERKIHNPKAYIPSAYIPAWLLQIPHCNLSTGAKLLYGRLAQWSNSKGQVHRSTKQLCQELGMTKSPMDRFLKELRDVGLIGTLQVVEGGVNHFEFYEHEWMTAELAPSLDHTREDSNGGGHGGHGCDDSATPASIPERSEPPTQTGELPPTQTGVPPHLPRCTPPHLPRCTPTPHQVSLKYKEVELKKYKELNISTSPSATSDDQILNTSNQNNAGTFSSDDLFANNPHEIEVQMIKDWIEVRKMKRSKVTQTAWAKINKTLALVKKETGISPQDAFETMVASGWLSIELKYFKDERKENGSNYYAGKSSTPLGILDTRAWD